MMNIDDGRGRGGFSRFPTPARPVPVAKLWNYTHCAGAGDCAISSEKTNIFSLSVSRIIPRGSGREKRFETPGDDRRRIIRFFFIFQGALSHTRRDIEATRRRRRRRQRLFSSPLYTHTHTPHLSFFFCSVLVGIFLSFLRRRKPT